MVMTLVALLLVGAGLYHRSATRKNAAWAEPKQYYLATLLLVSTNAFNDRNIELYQATIKEIICLMSNEGWERPEIEWRLRQALLIANEEISPEVYEKVSCVGRNIARWTVHNSNLLPWETRPFIKLLAQTQLKLST